MSFALGRDNAEIVDPEQSARIMACARPTPRSLAKEQRSLGLAYFLSKAFRFLERPGNLALLIVLIGTLVAQGF